MSDCVKARVQEIDVLRFVAIVAVVLIHTSDLAFVFGKPAVPDVYMLLWVNQATRFAIFLFLFLSGFSLAHSYKDMTLVGYGCFLVRRFRSIFPAYVLWSVVYMLYFGRKFTALNVADTLLFGKADFQMYFVPLILQFYLLFPLFIYMSRPEKRWLGGAAFFLINLCAMIAYGRYGLGGQLRIWFFSWCFFFFMGCVLGQVGYKAAIARSSKVVAILGAVCVAGASLIFFRTYQKLVYLGIPYGNATTALKTSVFVYSCFVIYFLLLFMNKMLKLVTGVIRVLLLDAGNASFEIFLTHMLVMRILINLKVFNIASFAGNLLLAFSCLLITYISLNILSLVPYFPSRLNVRNLCRNLTMVEG